jgi:acetoin utilization deacetylase AcuC-like enzyme
LLILLIPGVQIKAGPHATYEQLSRVHTTTHLDHIFSFEGKRAWLDRDTTAVSPESVQAATAAGNAIAAVECVVKGESQKAFREILIPAADYFKPDLLLVSAGCDPHYNDMALNVSYDGIADKHCNGRLVLVLEGGYNLTSLSRGVHTMLAVMAGGEAATLTACGVREVAQAAEFHRDAFKDE